MTPDTQYIGLTIKRLCGVHDVRQAELATAVEVSPQTITAIVRGQTDSRYTTLMKIFDWFGVYNLNLDWKSVVEQSLHSDDVELRVQEVRDGR